MNNTFAVVGIDIGLSGGIALVLCDGDTFSLAELHPMPVYREKIKKRFARFIDTRRILNLLISWKEKYHEISVIAEDIRNIYKVHKFSMYSLGRQRGIIEGICLSVEIPLILVNPATWQNKVFNKETTIDEDTSRKLSGMKLTKVKSYLTFRNLFPEWENKVTARKNIRDGLTDAALLAVYQVTERHNNY